MSRARIVFLALAVAWAAPACRKSDDGKANLPPAAGEGAAPLPDIPAVVATVVDGGTVGGAATPAEVRATGTLMARQHVTVSAKASGTIVAVHVDEGDLVKKGDVLFRTDTRDAVLMRKAAQTQLDGARLQLKTSQREYDRIAGLVAQNAMPRAQLDQLEAQVDGAKVSIAAAQNQLAMATKMIADATSRSPIDGVVVRKLMSAGEYAGAMPPSPVVVLEDQATLELKFPLPERAITSIRAGDVVAVQLPAIGQARRAAITQIAPSVNPQTRTIVLTAVLDNCDGALRPGMGAEVTVGGDAGDAAPAPECAKPATAPKPPAARKPAATRKPS
jgi:RND family efflux transporter MFP subunit